MNLSPLAQQEIKSLAERFEVPESDVSKCVVSSVDAFLKKPWLRYKMKSPVSLTASDTHEVPAVTFTTAEQAVTYSFGVFPLDKRVASCLETNLGDDYHARCLIQETAYDCLCGTTV